MALNLMPWTRNRSLTTPSTGGEVDPDKVSAAFKQGVLTITLPKKPDAQRQMKRIKVAAG